ncbi:unnamed protein product [Paramecium sonneborni]|uniref:Uncharacterized protein n=1 Tax=Paramecium sonneborni TaxID=65129 RepID=A0A8S1RUZ7_9CILI|nr:unnamed protein product [Paramecium sonneborni]
MHYLIHITEGDIVPIKNKQLNQYQIACLRNLKFSIIQNKEISGMDWKLQLRRIEDFQIMELRNTKTFWGIIVKILQIITDLDKGTYQNN